MDKIEVGKDVMLLHQKYIIENDKPKAGFPSKGTRNLNADEIRLFRQAFIDAPKIGRLRNNRKRDDELIAVPRGLIQYLKDEASNCAFFHDTWKRGELSPADRVEDCEDFNTILVCAVRYAIGRRTYMPSLVAGYIRGQSKRLTLKGVEVIIREIEGALKQEALIAQEGGHCYSPLGDDCDREVWVSLLDFLKQWRSKQDTPAGQNAP